MPRSTRQLAPSQRREFAAQMPGGNGACSPDNNEDRLARLERLLEALQKQLDVQFRRIADLQVQLDRSISAQSTRVR